MPTLTPQQIVQTLDQYIVGQSAAKRAVAIALRNRWRRLQLTDTWRQEITPKNILMIGPTGVGKTEIARRVAKLAQAPFIKVEATKFTEVGYVGKEVDSIIRDLVEIGLKLVRKQRSELVKSEALLRVEERILEALLPQKGGTADFSTDHLQTRADSPAKALLRDRLRAGSLEQEEIELLCSSGSSKMEILTPPGMEEMANQLQTMFQKLAGQHKKLRRLPIHQARQMLLEEETQRLVPTESIKKAAIEAVEQQGIVFIDEIDKLCHRSHHQQSDISREGVQRDLLPLVEGCTVSTKHGLVRTDHILFIASGAFEITTPSQLIPELQGRLPIRVELSALTIEDFERILTEPQAALTKQYNQLLQPDGIALEFTPCGVKKLAEAAFHVNQTTENIGARRLHTILEKLLEEIAFSANEVPIKKYVIDAKYVENQLGRLVQNEDLSRFVL